MRKTNVITISREYGAGGRTIAKALSERLDIPWYDQDLIKIAAEESGYSVENIESDGEEYSSASRILDKVLNSATSYTSTHDGIYRAQKETILTLGKGPCIIVGRCSNIIFEEAGIPSLDVYLYADLEIRAKRAAELSENGDVDLEKYIEKRDHLRSTYYRNYTKHELGDYHDYDLMLNTGLLGTEACVDIIVQALNK